MRLTGIRVFVKPFPLSNLEWQSFSEDQFVDSLAKRPALSGESLKPLIWTTSQSKRIRAGMGLEPTVSSASRHCFVPVRQLRHATTHETAGAIFVLELNNEHWGCSSHKTNSRLVATEEPANCHFCQCPCCVPLADALLRLEENFGGVAWTALLQRGLDTLWSCK